MKDRGLIYQTMWILNKEKRESGVEKFSKKWEFFTKPEGHESLTHWKPNIISGNRLTVRKFKNKKKRERGENISKDCRH